MKPVPERAHCAGAVVNAREYPGAGSPASNIAVKEEFLRFAGER